MASHALPILMPKMPWQRYSCHGCGNCCRDFTVQLRPEDIERLETQGWRESMGEDVVVHFRGKHWLKRRADGACVFLQDDGLCRIHATYGFAEKPIACQVFPFNLAPSGGTMRVGLNFLCRSVQDNKGEALGTHAKDVRRFAETIPEGACAAPEAPLAHELTAASAHEIATLLRVTDRWLTREDLSLATRFDGLAFLAQSLGEASLGAMRDARFTELATLLIGALPEELELQPIDSASPRQAALLRQAVFARTEDPMIFQGLGRLRTTVSQLRRSRKMRRGRGATPMISSALPEQVSFAAVNGVGSFAESPDANAIEELTVRWIRATLHGARAWGSAHYGWSVVDGLQGVVLNLACAGWVARLCAAGEGRPIVTLADVQRGIGRIDRHAGRAPWLGLPIERVRLRYFRLEDGLRRVVAQNC